MFNFPNKRQEEAGQSASGNSLSSSAERNEAQTADPAQEEFIRSRVAEIEEQRIAFLKKKPDFDMNAELENKAFVTYLWNNGLSVEDAYLLAHRDEVIENAVNESLKRSSDRRNRISENGAGKSSPVSVRKNPKEMTDKEIDSIIEKVKNGEKISF